MVVRISTGKSIQKILNYNEHKVSEGDAVLLRASSFVQATDQMSFHDKLEHFESYTSRNRLATANAFHVSLNFDPSEQLSDALISEIAAEYMHRIGFGYQPYLVYRHQDAGHPHVHVVSTTIRYDGSRICTHNLGRNESEKVRKELQEEYGLIKADGRRLQEGLDRPAGARKLEYGKMPTKRAMSSVLRYVLERYHFSSLPELNALLNNYNMVAETGAEGSRLKAFRGVVFGALDDKGNRVGAPVKASAFWFKPTLPFLERKFAEGDIRKRPYRLRLTTAIDWVMLGKTMTLPGLVAALQKEQIQLVVRKGKDGRIYGLTYIDHKNHTVFNGSTLGKAYSAAGIIARLSPAMPGVLKGKQMEATSTQNPATDAADSLKGRQADIAQEGTGRTTKGITAMDILMQPESDSSYVPFDLSADPRKKKKKKRRQL